MGQTEFKLYGKVTPDMSGLDKILERLRERILDMGYPAVVARNSAAHMASLLYAAGYRDEELLNASDHEFPEMVRRALGEFDAERCQTLKEAYGKAPVPIDE